MIRLMVHHTDLEISREGCKGCGKLFVLAKLDYCTSCTQYAILAYLSIHRRARVQIDELRLLTLKEFFIRIEQIKTLEVDPQNRCIRRKLKNQRKGNC